MHCLHVVLCFDVWKPLNACPRPAGCIVYLVKFMLQVVKYKHHMILLGIKYCKQHIAPLTLLKWCDLQSPHVPIFGVQFLCKSSLVPSRARSNAQTSSGDDARVSWSQKCYPAKILTGQSESRRCIIALKQ